MSGFWRNGTAVKAREFEQRADHIEAQWWAETEPGYPLPSSLAFSVALNRFCGSLWRALGVSSQ